MTKAKPEEWGWWMPANERRCQLLARKHLGDGISEEESVELEVLQGLADLVISQVGPDLSVIAPVLDAIGKSSDSFKGGK